MGSACARHSGPSQKLIVAFDIGTTFSSVAYAFVNPGQTPRIQYVTWQALLLILDLLAEGNKKYTGTPTMSPEGFHLYCITTKTEIPAGLRARLIYTMTKGFSE